jgi:hypothetical protein
MKKWNEDLWLLTPKEYAELDDGTTLQCIDNSMVVKGVDYIDEDVRFGHIAYGLTEALAKQQYLQNDFLMLLLKQ